MMTMQTVKSLLTETSHELQPEDIAAIIELDKAADVVVRGPDSKADSIYAYPLVYGGEVFHAPSIGKQLFWEEQVTRAIPEKWLPCAFLWLLTCQSVPDERGTEIAKTVKKWGRKCRLTSDEVQRVTNAYSADEDQGSGNVEQYGEIIALLVREYGKDCAHWLNAPEAEINMLLADWTRRQEAKAASYRRSKAGTKNPLPPLPSPKFKASKAYRLLSEKLRASWQNEK